MRLCPRSHGCPGEMNSFIDDGGHPLKASWPYQCQCLRCSSTLPGSDLLSSKSRRRGVRSPRKVQGGNQGKSTTDRRSPCISFTCVYVWGIEAHRPRRRTRSGSGPPPCPRYGESVRSVIEAKQTTIGDSLGHRRWPGLAHAMERETGCQQRVAHCLAPPEPLYLRTAFGSISLKQCGWTLVSIRDSACQEALREGLRACEQLDRLLCYAVHFVSLLAARYRMNDIHRPSLVGINGGVLPPTSGLQVGWKIAIRQQIAHGENPLDLFSRSGLNHGAMLCQSDRVGP